MKAILIALLLSGVSYGNWGPPLHVRLSIQFIEVPHPVLTELLAGEDSSGSALHAQAMALSKNSEAEILDTYMEHMDEWGDASMRMPAYERWAANTSVLIVSGKSELVSVITPKQQPPPPAVARRIMLFVRADVIEFIPNPQ